MQYDSGLDANYVEKDLCLLEAAVKAAGDIALSRAGKPLRIYYKGGKSPVTDVDLEIDRFLKDRLLTARPTYGWTSEESTDTRTLTVNPLYSFLLDPIDGTRGFINNSPYWCISVAVVNTTGRPIYGCVYCPALQEYYSASKFTRAVKNGITLLPLPTIKHKPKMRIACGKEWFEKLSPLALEAVEFVAPLPSIACTLLAAAKGDIDLVLVRPTCKAWDLAGAEVIFSSVGGIIADFKGRKLRYDQSHLCGEGRQLIAANQSLLPQILDWLGLTGMKD